MDDGVEFEAFTETLNGVELYFEVAGPADAAHTLIYLHGLGYNSFSFREVVGDSLPDHRVVYLDQRGCGRSAPLEADPALFTVDALVDDLEALRAHLEIRSFTPVGHGFGAVLALEYARRFPRHTSGVVAVSPWVHYPELAQTLLEAAERLTERDVPDPVEPELRAEAAFGLREDLLSVLHFPYPQARLHLEFVDAESGLYASGVAQETLAYNGLWSLEYPQYFPEIKARVTCIAGTMDLTSYPGQTDWLVDLLSAEESLLQTGHYVWLEDTDGFVAALEAALD
jgi:proline iminopeptidase